MLLFCLSDSFALSFGFVLVCRVDVLRLFVFLPGMRAETGMLKTPPPDKAREIGPVDETEMIERVEDRRTIELTRCKTTR